MPKQIATLSSEPLGTGAHSTRLLLPPFALALALNGFFLYLAALELVNIAPRTPLTATWYALLGLLCVAGATVNFGVLRDRLRRADWVATAWLVAAVVVASWFFLNVLLISHGSLSRTFAAELLFWSLPAALVAFSLPRSAFVPTAVAVAALAAVYVLIELGELLVSRVRATRFSPIAHLDPISAAQFPALGAIALLALRGRTPWEERARLGGVLVFSAATVLPGSRGPVLALVVGAVAVIAAAFAARRLDIVALVVGLAIGFGGAHYVGSENYLTSSLPGHDVPGLSAPGHEVASRVTPISTLRIRREWWTSAFEAIPNAPLVGHGVAMFVDNTPEAHRMGVAGQRTYPHNSALESVYSLGLLGALPYAVYLIAAVVALWAIVRRPHREAAVVALGVWVFAFVSTNLSGEIGADATLWAGAALAIGLYVDGSRNDSS